MSSRREFAEDFKLPLLFVATACATAALFLLCGCMTQQEHDAITAAIGNATKTAEGAALVAGQPQLIPLIAAGGGILTAVAGIWHTAFGLPGTPRNKALSGDTPADPAPKAS